VARTNPLDLLRTAAREGVHAGVTVGGKALGHAATLAQAGLVRGQAAVTAATARRRQPPAPGSRHTEPTFVAPLEPDVPEVEEAAPVPEPRSAAPATKKAPPKKAATKKAPPKTTKKTTKKTTTSPGTATPAPSPAEVAKRAQPRPSARPPAKKAARTSPPGPGAKLPPRREAEQD
jgi:hypothetical protein